MKKFLTLLTILTFFSSISHGQNQNATQENAQSYFPADIFRDRTSYSNEETRYSVILQAMNEPVIYSNDSLTEIYRFTWLRNLGNPIVIRIEKQENDYILSWKILNMDGAKYYYECSLIVNKQKTVDENTWLEFKNLLSQTDFWNMETNQKNVYCFDSTDCILEGKNYARYHVVDRCSPHTKSKYYKCCDFLIKLTDLRKSIRNKY